MAVNSSTQNGSTQNGSTQNGSTQNSKPALLDALHRTLLGEAEAREMRRVFEMPLGTAFRVNSARKDAATLRETLRREFLAPLQQQGWDVRTIPWIENEMGWSLGMDRRELRKAECHSTVHATIHSLAETGDIYRQEAVSMIPVELLDIHPDHRVLDMCAAPGSKTFQILEKIHAGSPETPPRGMLVANEIDGARCHLLHHTAKKMRSTALLVTQNDARNYPSVWGEGKILFDRVLCDVPCSSDGTLRKTP
ncbi:MAG: tRNA m(5)C methyltransferase NCL1, partial [Amphiamblys sp. WSBS2006]